MIIPVILEDTFQEIEKKVISVEKEAELVQIDFSDGNLSDRKSFMDYAKLSEIVTDTKLEVHLMVENPMEFLEYSFVNVVKVCTQVEIKEDIEQFLIKAKDKGYEVGLSSEISTSNSILSPYIELLDFMQFMTVNLGRQGQSFQTDVLNKIKSFIEMHPEIPVQVDGGLNEENIRALHEIGVSHFVVGSEIFSHGNPLEKYIELKNLPWIK